MTGVAIIVVYTVQKVDGHSHREQDAVISVVG